MDLSWVLDEFDGIIYVVDLHTYELLYMNRLGCEQFGVNRNTLSENDRKCFQILQNRTSPCPFCTNATLISTGFQMWEQTNPVLNKTFLLKDRKVDWNGREARIEFATDISLYRQEINHMEKEKESVLESVPGGIIRLDARDRKTVLWYGARFLPAIGYTKEQFENELHSRSDYIHPDDRQKVDAFMISLMKSGQSGSTEMRVVSHDGQIRIVNATFSYVPGESSEDGIPSFYSMGFDITQSKREQERQRLALEDAFHLAKTANMAKADFLSSMSHDIRTPLNAILGLTEIASAYVNDPGRIRDCLHKIDVSGRHLLNLVNEVLDMAKIESGKISLHESEFDLTELIQSVLDICRPLITAKNHEVKVRVYGLEHEKIVGDAGRLKQVFINLLSNAIKYTPARGHIEWTISEKRLSRPGWSRFEFVFADDGIGMEPEFARHVFEPFVRADDARIAHIQGTGLGLAISESIVHLMNGSIQVESVPGEGSRFVVDIPVKIHAAVDETGRGLAGRTVLVADDAETGEDVCRLLAEIGMNGKWVADAQAALEEIAEAHARGTGFFAVILDGGMAGLNGPEWLDAVERKTGQDGPLIVVSAYDLSQIGNEWTGRSKLMCLAKPFFKSKLIQLFSSIDNAGTVRAENVQEPETVVLAGRRVLVVEDNALNREIVQELLEMKGVSVDTAEDGEQALDKFARSPEGYYELILMDIRMPVKDGYEATIGIRALERKDVKTLPIIALTANAFSEDVKKALNAGMNEHIAKPVNANSLCLMLKKWLPARPSPGQPPAGKTLATAD